MKAYIVAGIRSQYVKIASLNVAIEKFNSANNNPIIPVYINTGQHYDHELAKQYIEEFGIHFDNDFTSTYSDLNPMTILGEMIIKLNNYFISIQDRNAIVLIFGDANTTLAGAIAASKARLKIAHIEAGVRCGNIKQTEEQNRVCADHLADFRFSVSPHDLINLQSEGLRDSSFWVGDIVYDLIKYLDPDIKPGIQGLQIEDYILMTMHREENVLSDKILRSIIGFLSGYPRPVVFITHPRTRKRLVALDLDKAQNIYYSESLTYKQMLSAIKGARFIVTDSGGMQRETFYLNKRSLVRQDQPFSPNLIEAGINKQIYSDIQSLTSSFEWIETKVENELIPQNTDHGDGSAAIKILHILSKALK